MSEFSKDSRNGLSATTSFNGSELPSYQPFPQDTAVPQTRPAERRQFSFSLETKGKAWATLKLDGNSELSRQLPAFLEGEPITGCVDLNLANTEPIQSVTISARGHLITGPSRNEHFMFLDHTLILWNKGLGDPRNPLPKPDGSVYNGRLQGDFNWPFSIELPHEISHQGGNGEREKSFALPPSFFERHTRTTVEYEIAVSIERKAFLKTEKRIQTQFVYHPFIQPEPFSPLRQLAYRENKEIPGPKNDPDGWHVIPAFKVDGAAFGNRSFSATCALALAKPLCYTRGTPLPCFLTIQCTDADVVERLASPRAIVLRVQRRVQHRQQVTADPDDPYWRDTVDHTESALWWPVDTSGSGRKLMGEVLLPQDLKPSAAMAHFKIEYTVVLFNFDDPSLQFPTSKPLASQPVTIATAIPSGPEPMPQLQYQRRSNGQTESAPLL